MPVLHIQLSEQHRQYHNWRLTAGEKSFSSINPDTVSSSTEAGHVFPRTTRNVMPTAPLGNVNVLQSDDPWVKISLKFGVQLWSIDEMPWLVYVIEMRSNKCGYNFVFMDANVPRHRVQVLNEVINPFFGHPGDLLVRKYCRLYVTLMCWMPRREQADICENGGLSLLYLVRLYHKVRLLSKQCGWFPDPCIGSELHDLFKGSCVQGTSIRLLYSERLFFYIFVYIDVCIHVIVFCIIWESQMALINTSLTNTLCCMLLAFMLLTFLSGYFYFTLRNSPAVSLENIKNSNHIYLHQWKAQNPHLRPTHKLQGDITSPLCRIGYLFENISSQAYQPNSIRVQFSINRSSLMFVQPINLFHQRLEYVVDLHVRRHVCNHWRHDRKALVTTKYCFSYHSQYIWKHEFRHTTNILQMILQ